MNEKNIGDYLRTFCVLEAPRPLSRVEKKNLEEYFQPFFWFRGKEVAEKWCESRAISEKNFIEKILNTSFVPFEQIFPEEFAFALQAQAKAPVKMGGAGSLSVIYYINEYVSATKSIETGVAYGWSSFAALASLVHRKGTLYSSDMPYVLQNQSDDFVGCVIPEKYRNKWDLYRFADKESLPKIFSKVDILDVVHYDSDKTYDGRIWAYNLLWNRLRKGGVFMSDDISDNAAFKDFCEKNNFNPHIIEFDGKYAGIVIKD